MVVAAVFEEEVGIATEEAVPLVVAAALSLMVILTVETRAAGMILFEDKWWW